MKKYIVPALLAVILFSCKKQSASFTPPPPKPVPPGYMLSIKTYLKQNLLPADYAFVDFNNSVLSRQTGGWFLRIGLLHKSLSKYFVLLLTDSSGRGIDGKFIHINNDSPCQKLYKGKITIESFQHENVTRTVIVNGVTQTDCAPIQEESTAANSCANLVPACSNCLPEVLVVGYYNSNGTGGSGSISYSDYIALSGLVSGSESGTAGSVQGGGSAAGSGSSGSGNGSNITVYSPIVIADGPEGSNLQPKTSADLVVNYEQSATKPAIDVNAFVKCFSTIADEGATCSVTMYDDLPVNDDPSYIFNITSGATGHCFLQLTKTNGLQSVTQIIGFTTSKLLALTGVPVPGKIVDNSGHKYNATFSMSLTTAQLATEIQTIVTLGNNLKYAIWDYNCVNYALQVLNAVRPSNPLEPVLLGDPETGDQYSTPQGLYMMLEQMKASGSTESKNITLGVVQYAGAGHGPCN